MTMNDLVYINSPVSFYHGMSGELIYKGEKVSVVRIDTWGKVSDVTFYNQQVSTEEIDPF